MRVVAISVDGSSMLRLLHLVQSLECPVPGHPSLASCVAFLGFESDDSSAFRVAGSTSLPKTTLTSSGFSPIHKTCPRSSPTLGDTRRQPQLVGADTSCKVLLVGVREGLDVCSVGCTQLQPAVPVIAGSPSRTSSNVVLGLVGDDSQHPRPHRAGAAVAVQPAMSLDECFLHDVERLLGASADDRCNPQCRVLMSPNKFAERLPVAVAGAQNECIVVARVEPGTSHRS
jgi:hypothetical protein